MTMMMSKYILRTKIVLDEKGTEQLSHFRYLGGDVTYDVDQVSVSMWHSSSSVIEVNKQQETRLKLLYKVMVVSVLLYDSDIWVPVKKHLSRIHAS